MRIDPTTKLEWNICNSIEKTLEEAEKRQKEDDKALQAQENHDLS